MADTSEYKDSLAKYTSNINDAAIEAVCITMKEARMKNHLVFYYLLAEKYNKLGVFS